MAEHQLAILGRLAEVGLEIAIALEAQAKGGERVVEGDLAMAYNRVARAVRQAVMLQSRLVEALQGAERAGAERKAAAKGSAARILRGVVEDERGNDIERVERLKAEAAERLEQEDFSDLDARPFAEIVAGICRDLGLTPDWLELARDCAAAQGALGGRPAATPADAPDDDDDQGPVEVYWLDEDGRPVPAGGGLSARPHPPDRGWAKDP